MKFLSSLRDRNFWRVTLALALPVAFQQLLTASFSLVDTLMVSQLGKNELAAVGMAGQYSMLFNMGLFGFCSAAGVFGSQYWGAKDKDGINRTCGMTLTCAFISTMIFVLLAALFPYKVMGFLTKDIAVLEIGVSYIRIAVWSYPALYLSSVFSSILRSTEHVKLPMIVSGISAVLNGVFNYALIFGKLGMPTLGIRGAAIATCISSWCAPLLLLTISILQKNILYVSPFRWFSFKMAHLKEYLQKALPVAFNESLWGLGTFLVGAIFSNYSTDGYAARTILSTFENICFVFFIGLCNAACIMIGKSVGEGKTERAVEDSKRFAVLVPLFGVFIGAFIILFRSPLVNIFNMGESISESTLAMARTLMLIYAIEMPVRNIPYIQIVGIFRSGGDTTTGVRYDLVSLWLISLPVTYIAAFVFHLPFPVIFLLMYVSEDYLKSLLCLRYFFTMKWIKPVTEEGKEGLRLWKEKRLQETAK